MSNLRNTPVGSTVTVRKIEGEGATRRRIMDMGITRGAEIYVRKVAPLGDPVEITVRGYELSLRKADAEMIQVDGFRLKPRFQSRADEKPRPLGTFFRHLYKFRDTCSRNLWICAANPILCVLRTKRGYRFAADENSLNFFYIGVSGY